MNLSYNHLEKVIPPIGIIDISSIAAIIVLVLFQKGYSKSLIGF